MRSLAKFILPVLLLAALVAGCGGGGSSGLNSRDVAVVGKTHISKSDYDTLLAQAKRSLGKTFPKQGTAEFESIKSKAVTLLVQQAERAERASSEGIRVSEAQVDKRLASIKKRYFKNSEAKYRAQLKQLHLTDKQVRDDIRSQLIYEAIVNKITKSLSVSDSEVHDYYIAHPQLYSKAQTRDVRHILVKSKPLAQSIYTQLKSELEERVRQAHRFEGPDRAGLRRSGVLGEDEGDPCTDPRQDLRMVRDRAPLHRPPAHHDAGEAGGLDDQGHAADAEKEPGDHGLVQQPVEELLQRRQDQVPGRLQAVA